MRKDLRLGLGIGALALLFAVTFLVVRNHTQSQAEGDPEVQPLAAVDGAALPPGANIPAATGGGSAHLPTIILPPLQPVPAPPAAATAKPPTDPFDRRTTRVSDGAMRASDGATSARTGSNWDVLLSEGRREPISSVALNRTQPPSVTTDPVGLLAQPPASRTPPAASPLSIATGRPYTIRQGDTFSSVAKQTYGAEKFYLQIEQANPNVNTMRLRPGQQIILPELPADTRAVKVRTGPFDNEGDNRPVNGRTEYRVDTGDSLYRISMKLYGHPNMTTEIYEANRAAIGTNPDRLRLGMILRLPEAPEGK